MLFRSLHDRSEEDKQACDDDGGLRGERVGHDAGDRLFCLWWVDAGAVARAGGGDGGRRGGAAPSPKKRGKGGREIGRGAGGGKGEISVGAGLFKKKKRNCVKSVCRNSVVVM